ncbi:hypothetical protein [Pseudomonas tolaasii]|uniref:hypothetical protein n=1 Tax=Pseudomonas tolaasii TaxID=29442 RepID=UPI0027345C00|nr:hypothetical protein [Pseudomonas tolaasii]WLH54017.1 hypothetical protein PSH62_10535 [Pseudomonas tolaasii]
MKLNYSQSKGLENFFCGQGREDVRKVIGLPYRVFPKTEFSENSNDAFGEAVMQAWYNSSNELLGLEVYFPNACFYYDGKQILGLSIEEVERFFVAEGVSFEVEKDKTGINVNQNSVRLYAPDMGDLGGRATVEAVYVGFK